MKRLVVGILAHVDSGKTTLSEGMLYCSGEIRKLGRVDHKDSFLDTYSLERDRGITIFSKQAVMHMADTEITLLDTPGHIDFSAETERTLQVLDYAILVINASDGIQNHTRTLWKLLERYDIPVFVFVNKMDLPGTDRALLTEQLQNKLSDSCLDFSYKEKEIEFYEEAAFHDEKLMHEYLENGKISDDHLSECIMRRKIYPCYFGSALKLDGIQFFLDELNRYTCGKQINENFAAKVFKISEDDQGNRLTNMKITGGSLKVKTVLNHDDIWSQKINHIRIYSGAKFRPVEEVYQGMVCAVTGLTETYPGEGLGDEDDSRPCQTEPVLTYKAQILSNTNINDAVSAFKKLETEEPKLHVFWSEQLKEIHVQVMGEMQLEVLRSILAERFEIDVEFVQGNVAYKETISNTVEGVGHYEPLRHYAEVHLLLEPGERGSGLQIFSDCREEILDKNWQRLIMTHLKEKTHIGVLTGSPVTDIKITVISGRAHLKHTEGGDFRQATYRAVRNALRYSDMILLEPWYDYTLEIPAECVGRAISDLTKMDCVFSAPETIGDTTVITGKAPVASVRGYYTELCAYTHGKGIFICTLSGYEPCHNTDEVVEAMAYDCDSDIENSADSVFCAHGSGFIVKWNNVGEHMHLPGLPDYNYGKKRNSNDQDKGSSAKSPHSVFRGSIEDDKELMAIFEKTYGNKDNDKRKNPFRTRKELGTDLVHAKPVSVPKGPEYLLVDGYNIIFSWEELKKIASDNMDLARSMLINTMCNYQGINQCEVIVVFDAYKIKGCTRDVEKYNNISIVYTREAETADMYIEKITHELSHKHRVRVATSDGLEQLIILGNGALRISASELYEEVRIADERIQEYIRTNTK